MTNHLKEKLKRLKAEREKLVEEEDLKKQIKEEEKLLKEKKKKGFFRRVAKGIKAEINKYEFKK